MAPNVLERLRGTPARVAERVSAVAGPTLVRRRDGAWSIQEHVGHLGDLEALWLARVDDYEAGRTELTVADLQNRATHEANHNARAVAELLARFRGARGALVGRLERLDEAGWARTALHPRLRTPMRALDFAFFVAEHDDHHLVSISELVRG